MMRRNVPLVTLPPAVEEEIRHELAVAIRNDLDRMWLCLPGHRWWSCHWCGAVYHRDVRPPACQRCHCTLFRLN